MGSQAIQSALWGRNHANWASIQEATSLECYKYVLDELQMKPNEALLDIGCGSGLFCSLAAQRFTVAGSSATGAANDSPAIIGFDATTPLLEEARQRAPQLTFITGDMEALPFDDTQFDIVTAFNSFQYAASVPNALKEAHRVLKPGGRLVAMIWGNKQDCEAASYLAAIGSLLPPPPPGAPGPFALSEDKKLADLLITAGFKITSSTDLPATWDYPDPETALNGLLSAGPATRAIDHSGPERVSDTIKKAIQPYTQPDGHIIYHNKFRIVMATR